MKHDFGDWIVFSIIALLIAIMVGFTFGCVYLTVNDISICKALREQGYAVVRIYGNGHIVMKDGNIYLYQSGQFVQLQELPAINKNSGTALMPVPIIIH